MKRLKDAIASVKNEDVRGLYYAVVKGGKSSAYTCVFDKQSVLGDISNALKGTDEKIVKKGIWYNSAPGNCVVLEGDLSNSEVD